MYFGFCNNIYADPKCYGSPASLGQPINVLNLQPFLTSLKLLLLALCVNKFTHTRLLAIFNLVQLSYILTLVFLSVLFWKSTKNRAVVYGIRCFLCSRVALQHLSVGAHLAARCLSQCLGWQELAALKHHATCFQALLGCSLCLPTLPFRPWRGITFCNEQARRIVILNTAPPDFAGEPRKAGS